MCCLSCSDATAMQTPFPPADSVGSLRRCGLGVLVAGRRKRGVGVVGVVGGGWVWGSHISPTSLSHAREKSWLIVSTMAPCTLSHSTTNHSLHQYFYCNILPLLGNPNDLRKCANIWHGTKTCTFWKKKTKTYNKAHQYKVYKYMQVQLHMHNLHSFFSSIQFANIYLKWFNQKCLVVDVNHWIF